VQPQLAENIGMVARSMANFGLNQLRLVAPRDGWPKKGAHSAASGAAHLIENAQLYDDVPAAIADLHTVYATTARERGQAKRVYVPEEVVPLILASSYAKHRTGILFGKERAGLSNDDIALSDAIITYPVNPDFSSLNLAQAVLLIGYEWFKTHTKTVSPVERTSPQNVLTPPARREEVMSLFQYLEEELEKADFFPPNRQTAMMHNLTDMLHRLHMNEQDVRTLRGMLSALVNGRRGGKNQPRPSRQKQLALRDKGETTP
jgi:tRNA/rRNA methyltransferase